MTRAQIAQIETLIDAHRTLGVLDEVAVERAKQDARFGLQDICGNTGGPMFEVRLIGARGRYEAASTKKGGPGAGWAEILDEECSEALAETDPDKLREELIQTAACAVGFVEALDRRKRREQDAADRLAAAK